MRRSRCLVMVLAVWLGGCASSSVVRAYERVEVASVPMPEATISWCNASPQLMKGEVWLVFISDPCPSCRRMLRWLDRQDKAALLVVLYTESCAQAKGALRGRAYPFAAASSELGDAWYVESTPTAYLLRDGLVVERLIGVPK